MMLLKKIEIAKAELERLEKLWEETKGRLEEAIKNHNHWSQEKLKPFVNAYIIYREWPHYLALKLDRDNPLIVKVQMGMSDDHDSINLFMLKLEDFKFILPIENIWRLSVAGDFNYYNHPELFNQPKLSLIEFKKLVEALEPEEWVLIYQQFVVQAKKKRMYGRNYIYNTTLMNYPEYEIEDIVVCERI